MSIRFGVNLVHHVTAKVCGLRFHKGLDVVEPTTDPNTDARLIKRGVLYEDGIEFRPITVVSRVSRSTRKLANPNTISSCRRLRHRNHVQPVLTASEYVDPKNDERNSTSVTNLKKRRNLSVPNGQDTTYIL